MNDMLPEVNYDRLPNRSASLLQTVHMDILQQTEELKEYARTNIDALPKEDMKTIRKRGKRSAPLAFIGGLSKSLFCTATYDDVAKVARKVNRIIATERKLDKGVLHLTENLESYMKVNDDRTDRIKALVDATHGEVQAVEKTLQAMRSMEKVKKEFLINLTTAMDSQMYIAGKLRERLIEIRYAIDALSEGKLPKSLITVQDIQSVLTDANEQIGVRKHFGDRFRFTVLTPIST
ncbi:uncharacterized protein LOC123544099 [Mercenaria mercenaria]|uniref:uncharacterized protein LOC123544099 n=1 Tax=Mercenaria mercenaria TaxID=6596 RepID=UPI00234EAAED|nr:uncharacterized protein LOC123544099 [Mercenaria mercenaria]